MRPIVNVQFNSVDLKFKSFYGLLSLRGKQETRLCREGHVHYYSHKLIMFSEYFKLGRILVIKI